MNDDGLYLSHPELLSAEEKEDKARIPNSSTLPDLPLFVRNQILEDEDVPAPDALDREEFEMRRPALGWTADQIQECSDLNKNPLFQPVQKRRLFRMVRSRMLHQLISTSGCSTVEELLDILRQELTSGVPAPVPAWYKFSTVTMGPRKVGYDKCSMRDCFITETLDDKFQVCSGCNVT